MVLIINSTKNKNFVIYFILMLNVVKPSSFDYTGKLFVFLQRINNIFIKEDRFQISYRFE